MTHTRIYEMNNANMQIIEKYLKICKENFDNDGWFDCTAEELYENPDKIGETWKINHGATNSAYLGILYEDISSRLHHWDDKTVLDYGCGFGGNLVNLHKLANWSRYIGYDISPYNVAFTKKYLNLHNIPSDSIYETNGYSMTEIADETVDFATSFVVFQHIALLEIKLMIFEEIYRVLKKGGIFSFQMNRWDPSPHALDYKTNCSYFTSHPRPDEKLESLYKGKPNCVLTTPDDIVVHLQQVGFGPVEIVLSPNPVYCHTRNIGGRNGIPGEWVYIIATKTHSEATQKNMDI